MQTSTKQARTIVTIEIPENFKVLDGTDFLKLKGLVKTGLEIIERIGETGERDETGDLLWPILQVASDIFDQHRETLDVLSGIKGKREEQ